MFSLSAMCKNSSSITYLVLQARYKSKVHWAKLRKKNSPKDKAMSHFDEFYGSVFGEKWAPMREALLRKRKYVAVVNNYGDAEGTIEYLANRGAHDLRKLMSVQQEFHNTYSPEHVAPSTPTRNSDKLDAYAAKLQDDEISSIYPGDSGPDRLDTKDMVLRSQEKSSDDLNETPSSNANKSTTNTSQELDVSRVIDPSLGITSDALYQFLPATKLKGMDDWVPESLHYSYYSNEKDFPLVTEPETDFNFPEHLKVFTYEMDSEWTKFAEPKRCDTGVYNYYPMDCGSVLGVLALCLAPGDRVLDLCAGPGGKSLVALQTLLPDIVVCNDSSISRANRIQRIFSDYFFEFQTSNRWRERVLITTLDGRVFTDEAGFDKVLVDVPCTTDRHSVAKTEDNNIFRPDRVKERLMLPELQSQLLSNALSLVKVGGAVVYSTCSLSPIQNDGVVHMALKHAFETKNITAAVRDLTPAMVGLSSTLSLATGSIAPRYGQLVVPSIGANFGPSYIARLVRLQ